uniref:WD repeat-containing protein 52 n=1 Tax=Lygus hesperus TaxID=30085 RepID=A0A0A9YSY3_LYGHE
MSKTGDLKDNSAISLDQSEHLGGAGSSGSRRDIQNNESSNDVQEEKGEEKDVTEEALDESEIGEDVDEYETTDFISLPKYSEKSTFKQDPLELEYSFGYDCKRPNLCVVDPNTLLWYTGNIIHIFDAKKRHLTFRRSALGQDISCLAKSKATDEFAVAEKRR